MLISELENVIQELSEQMKREQQERSATAAKNANSVLGDDLLAAELPMAANEEDGYADV